MTLNVRECINWLSREKITELLEENGMQVFESESTDELEEALFQSVDSGDIPEDAIRSLVE